MASTEMDRIRAFIKKHGPTEVGRLTGMSRRAVQYLQNGDSEFPTYKTLQKLREAMKR